MFLLGGNWVDESMALIGGITYGQIGLVLMVLSFAAGMAVYFMGKGRSHLFLAAALTMQLLFALTTKMHERYILRWRCSSSRMWRRGISVCWFPACWLRRLRR